MAATPWVMIANLASLSTLITNIENGEDKLDKEADDEGDSGDDQADEKLRLSKRHYNHMEDDESMPPLHSSTRLAQLIDSSPVKPFDSASELTGLIINGDQEPKYVAVAPTTIASNLSVEGQKPFYGATRGDFAWIGPLFLLILFWIVLILRARKQRRRLDGELERLCPSPEMEMKGDLESGSV